MIYRFEDFELDTAKAELRSKGIALAIEPQVFALLALLIENRERLVTKDEIVERVWSGRIVSESAVSSRIKSARQALGDDGRAQRFIKTLHGVGLRFVGTVEEMGSTAPQTRLLAPEPVELASPQREGVRPSIAVLPFRLVGVGDPDFAIAEALPHDLITELSRLRWLFVIARGSSFQFRSIETDIERVRAELGVRYCLSGVVEITGGTMIVSVELSETNDKGVVWSDRYRAAFETVHEVREEIACAVTNALELQIPLNEARRARLKAPQQLDAWSAYHLGLQHMYRFNKPDNAIAASLFERAAALDPGFSRAYAGLSFTHFQDAFLRYADDVAGSAKLAQHYAEKSLELDPVDPFGNFTMGRAFWLKGDLDSSLPWLDRANMLNPNYAQARYSRAWAEALLGRAKESQASVDEALMLSPLDPLRYGMLGVRAFSHIVLGESGAAAEWAERAAASPGAHALIEMIAVVAHGLAGNDARAKIWAISARKRATGLSREAFFRAFPFRDASTQKCIADMLKRYGF